MHDGAKYCTRVLQSSFTRQFFAGHNIVILYTCMHACVYACISVIMYTSTRNCVSVCIGMDVCIHTCKKNTSMCVCTHVYTHRCELISIVMYIPKHTYM